MSQKRKGKDERGGPTLKKLSWICKFGQDLCGAVDSTVASDTRGPGFESRRRQLLLNIFTVNYL